MNYLAAAHAQSATSQYFTLLLVSAVLTTVGAITAFDLFGFVSKFAIPPSHRSMEMRERRGLPAPSKVVGGFFLCVGAPVLIITLIVGIIALV